MDHAIGCKLSGEVQALGREEFLISIPKRTLTTPAFSLMFAVIQSFSASKARSSFLTSLGDPRWVGQCFKSSGFRPWMIFMPNITCCHPSLDTRMTTTLFGQGPAPTGLLSSRKFQPLLWEVHWQLSVRSMENPDSFYSSGSTAGTKILVE